MLELYLIFLHCVFSLTVGLHFLGGSFTYKSIQTPKHSLSHKSILVEIRFYISDHFFFCTPEHINQHLIAYLIGETVPYDNVTNQYLWNQTQAINKNKYFYNIQCHSELNNNACENFQERTWAYCESANALGHYSILRREFLLIVEKLKPIQLYYSSCCWANSSNKYFYFNLSIETQSNRINSSPYPLIPATYFVDYNEPNVIELFVHDADGDTISCTSFETDMGRFLTVHADDKCRLTYQKDRAGKQFGQFWLMDTNRSRILSRSLISVQVQVLKNVTCHTRPSLLIKNLNPKCPFIQPQDQTITELTTLCTNSRPILLTDGGIEVIYQCKPALCEAYHICFIGEFGFKLPATEIQCYQLQVHGTEVECAFAASNYDYIRSRNRHFVILEPIIRIDKLPVRTRSRETLIFVPEKKWTTQLIRFSAEKSSSLKWTWPLFVVISFLIISVALYCMYGRKFFKPKRHFSPKTHNNLSEKTTNRITIESEIFSKEINPLLINNSTDLRSQQNDFADLQIRAQSRPQYVRLSPFDEDHL